ncbi:MAG: tripartite tricarboxylate transporter TctB family protein [Spirochaetia bacterium]|jgi:putative tricarboxylic transport membrane protein|nr:tripartite tricarboxylate transporter TctB family protein [Spirochaetia bacterium]
MEIIKFLGKGPGFWVLLTVLTVIFLSIVLIILKSSKKQFAGRLIIPVFFMEFAIFFGILALGFPDRGDEVGPGVVPLLWIIGIFGFGIILLIRGVIGHEKEDPTWGRIGKVSIFIALTILYLLIMQIIGYYLATTIYLISGMYYLAYRDWKVMISISAGWILFSYFAFYRLLYVPLPKGLLIEWIFG